MILLIVRAKSTCIRRVGFTEKTCTKTEIDNNKEEIENALRINFFNLGKSGAPIVSKFTCKSCEKDITPFKFKRQEKKQAMKRLLNEYNVDHEKAILKTRKATMVKGSAMNPFAKKRLVNQFSALKVDSDFGRSSVKSNSIPDSITAPLQIKQMTETRDQKETRRVNGQDAESKGVIESRKSIVELCGPVMCDSRNACTRCKVRIGIKKFTGLFRKEQSPRFTNDANREHDEGNFNIYTIIKKLMKNLSERKMYYHMNPLIWNLTTSATKNSKGMKCGVVTNLSWKVIKIVTVCNQSKRAQV